MPSEWQNIQIEDDLANPIILTLEVLYTLAVYVLTASLPDRRGHKFKDSQRATSKAHAAL